MTDRQDANTNYTDVIDTDVSKFTDSYASFNRIINSLQRKYLELKSDFSEQNEELAETNKRLVEMTARNLKAGEFLNSIIGSMSTGVIAVNQNGCVTHFNQAASLMLGIPSKGITATYYADRKEMFGEYHLR